MSTERHCRIYRATDNKWYVELGDREYASRSESKRVNGLRPI